MTDLIVFVLVLVTAGLAIWFGLSGARTEWLFIGLCAAVIIVMEIAKSAKKKGKR